MLVSDNGKKKKTKNPQTDSSCQAAPDPGVVPRGSAAQRPQPEQRPAARDRGCAGERRSRGAGASLSDKDRGFMINLGRFKYLLS